VQPSELQECLDCGVCCFSRLDTYVPVTGGDRARLGAQAEALTVFTGNRCYMRMDGDHCAALQCTDEGQWACGAYAQRPAVCRELVRGGAACAAEREQKGERPPQLLALQARLPSG
jgi:hypothetical protein